MSHPHPFVRLAAIALGLSMAGTAAATGTVAASPACDASLRLVWIDRGRTSRGVLDEAEREASRIWAPAGITFDWARSTPTRAIRADEVLVMVREHLAGRPHTDLRVGRRHALGRVILVTPDRPSRLIELALPVGHGVSAGPDAVRTVDPRLAGRVPGSGRGPRPRPCPGPRDRALAVRPRAHAGRSHARLDRTAQSRRPDRACASRRVAVSGPRSAPGPRRACTLSCLVRQPVTEQGTVSCL